MPSRCRGSSGSGSSGHGGGGGGAAAAAAAAVAAAAAGSHNSHWLTGCTLLRRQKCGSYGPQNYTYHDAAGNPVVDTEKFPDMKAMVDVAHSLGLTAGWCESL